VNAIEVQWLEWHQAVLDWIVQMAMDPAAVVITVMFQGCTSPAPVAKQYFTKTSQALAIKSRAWHHAENRELATEN